MDISSLILYDGNGCVVYNHLEEKKKVSENLIPVLRNGMYVADTSHDITELSMHLNDKGVLLDTGNLTIQNKVSVMHSNSRLIIV